MNDSPNKNKQHKNVAKTTQATQNKQVYNKKKDDEEEEEEEEDDNRNMNQESYKPNTLKQNIMLFDLNQFQSINAGSDVKELFQYMKKFTPNQINLDTKIKPFIPAFIPSIGEVDSFVKVPRPDNLQDELGLNVLDEPCLDGTDPAIFSIELSYKLKTKLNPYTNVSKVENAEKNPRQVQNWIDKISDLHKQKMNPNVTYTKQMPDLESLMQLWPQGLEKIIKEIAFPDEKLNMSIADYSKLICNMVDIPIHKLNNNKSTVEALHVLFTLYSEFKENQHFQQDQKNNK